MSGLAQICHTAGYTVAGSDKETSHRTDLLIGLGIQVFFEHDGNNILSFQPDCVVFTAAVPRDNPELIEAAERNIPVYERSRFLGGINRIFDKVINISGTHGKTTTTTMCSLILEDSGLDPTAHIGAEVSSWRSPVRVGQSHNLFVSEACEYNSSFLQFFSTTAAILNIDHDHVDCFPTIDDVIAVFAKFACTLPSSGFLVLPAFDPHIPAMLEQTRACKMQKAEMMPSIVTFGRETDLIGGEKPGFYCSDYHLVEGYPSFDVYTDERFFCHIDLVIPGEHNVMNALAAIACAVLNGGSKESCVRVLSDFHGADNRFSERGDYRGARIVADYAHHPSAIRASYTAATNIAMGHDVWAVFQPITYNRAIHLFDEFVDALNQCRFSMIFEVYTSRESDAQGFSSRLICESITGKGGQSVFLDRYEDLKEALDKNIRAGDIVLIMGPEGMKQYADRLVKDGRV
jgi:UDP-N-acetylmuramate--alanine ligase